MGGQSRGWGRDFDADRLADLELRAWMAYYRRQPGRLFGLLVLANREQARASWLRALASALWLAKTAAAFGHSTGDYARFEPGIRRGYRLLGLPDDVDVAEVARRELRWWVVRREIGLAAGEEAGRAITALYVALYGLPEPEVAEAGELRGRAAEVRDRGATADPDGPGGRGDSYWPEVGRLLRASYRSLRAALDAAPTAVSTGVSESSSSAAAANAYQFVTTWRMPATAEEVAAVLGDAESLTRWWPAVYLDVDVDPPGGSGVGTRVSLWTKGWLPYTLRWTFQVTESDPPRGFRIEASGDFVGRGIWTFRELRPAGDPDGPLTEVEYDWRILAEKGVLRRLSVLVKPLFAANHRWAMARGEESLRLELARRHAGADHVLLAAIPRPPAPTFPHNLRRRRG